MPRPKTHPSMIPPPYTKVEILKILLEALQLCEDKTKLTHLMISPDAEEREIAEIIINYKKLINSNKGSPNV